MVSRSAQERLVRHEPADRAYHWLMAVCVLTLLLTAFLPILGIKFPWVLPHWIAGVVLSAAVLFHVVRALGWQDRGSMAIGMSDLRHAWQSVRSVLDGSDVEPPKSGKYLLLQKLYHHVVAVVLLVTIGTGLVMLLKIDTPWWKRDPSWLSDQAWGVVYVLHGIAALCSITLIMVHVYFALRPEKLRFTRSMILGWITREEYSSHHDPRRWAISKREPR